MLSNKLLNTLDFAVCSTGISKLFSDYRLENCKINLTYLPDEAGSCKAGVRLQVFTLVRNEKKKHESLMKKYTCMPHRETCVCENLIHPQNIEMKEE